MILKWFRKIALKKFVKDNYYYGSVVPIILEQTLVEWNFGDIKKEWVTVSASDIEQVRRLFPGINEPHRSSRMLYLQNIEITYLSGGEYDVMCVYKRSKYWPTKKNKKRRKISLLIRDKKANAWDMRKFRWI